MSSATVIIVGGGVIGLSTAYQLARKRFGKVILLEKGPVGDGSSSRAGGIIPGYCGAKRVCWRASSGYFPGAAITLKA